MSSLREFEDCTEVTGWMVADLFDASQPEIEIEIGPRQKLAIILTLCVASWVPVFGVAAWFLG